MSDYVVVTSTSNTVTVVNQPTTLVIADSAMRGPRGVSGTNGVGITGAMFFYVFDTNPNEGASNTGFFRCDNPNDQANITKLWFNNLDVASSNVGNAITTYFNSNSTPKGFISARGFEPGFERIQASVNDVTLKSGYFELDITVLANSPNDIDFGDLTGFNFSRNGNIGLQGPPGGAPIEAYVAANIALTTANAAYGQANAAYNTANLITWVSVPASNTSVGTAGQAAYDANGDLYICVSSNLWSKISGNTIW